MQNVRISQAVFYVTGLLGLLAVAITIYTIAKRRKRAIGLKRP